MAEPRREPYQPPGQAQWGISPDSTTAGAGSTYGPGSAIGSSLSELNRRKSFQRHRWLVMVQGAGAGLLSLGALLGLAWALDKGSLGAVCLLVLLLALLLIVAIVFFIITFGTATILGLRGKGRPIGRRLMGLLPLLALVGGSLLARLVDESQAPFGDGHSSQLLLGSFWLGVAFINLNGVLEIPAARARLRQVGSLVSFLPFIVVVLMPLLPVGDEEVVWMLMMIPGLAAALSGLVIFNLMGRALPDFGPARGPPGQAAWRYPR